MGVSGASGGVDAVSGAATLGGGRAGYEQEAEAVGCPHDHAYRVAPNDARILRGEVTSDK